MLLQQAAYGSDSSQREPMTNARTGLDFMRDFVIF